ncbi:MAG: hypothetical protein ACRC33_12805 [Gemmataceae bacterium]
MNDGKKGSAWSGFWWLLIFVTLTVALPGAIQENGSAGGWAVGVFLAFEVLMLALPGMLDAWDAGRPARERARADAREQASARRQQRAEREETRRRNRSDARERRSARAAEAQARRDALAARREAEAFYRTHAALLADVLPPALFRAEVESALPPGTRPEAAWQVARDLIGRMQPLVREAQESRREEERRDRERAERLRDIDAQIRAREARIRTLRAAGPDADFAEDEAAREREFIEQLREQREALLQQPR